MVYYNDLLTQILKKKKKDNSSSSSSSSSTSSDSTDSSSNSESKKKAKKVSKKRLKKRKIDKKHGEGTSTPKKFDARNIINKNKDSSNKKAALRKMDRQTDRDDKIEKLRNVKTIGDYLSFQEQYFKLYLIRTTDKAKCCPNYNLGVICKQKDYKT